MNRLHPWSFGFAGAVTFSIVYSACAVAVVLSPDGAIAFFNAWFHGLDLGLLKPPGGRPLALSQFIYGLVSAAAVSFAIAASLAGLYNLFTSTCRGVERQSKARAGAERCMAGNRRCARGVDHV